MRRVRQIDCFTTLSNKVPFQNIKRYLEYKREKFVFRPVFHSIVCLPVLFFSLVPMSSIPNSFILYTNISTTTTDIPQIK